MWFKLAGADFSKNNLGTMSSISSSYLIDYTGLTGMSGSPSSVSYAGSDAGTSKSVTVTVTITSGYTFKNGSTISASGGKSGTVFTADKDYTGGQTFTFSMAITANTKLSGTAEATGGSSSGGGNGGSSDGGNSGNTSGTLITSGSLKDSYLIEQAGYISNTYSEGIKTDTAYFIYDLIPVEPNTTYRLQYGRAAFFLESDKSQIGSRANLTSGYDDWTFTTPSNCAYLSVAFKYSEVATSAVVLESASVGEWVEKSTTLIKDTGAIFTDGYGWESSSYTFKAAEGFYSYAEIPVKASTRYKIENARSTWFLKSDKTALSRMNLSKDVTDFTFETPAGAAYLSTCWQHAEKNKDEASIIEYEFVATT